MSSIITWQNVPVGDLSGAQEGIRTASMLLDRAARSGQAITGEYQAMQEAERQAVQDAANKALMTAAYQAKTPEELQQQRAALLADRQISRAVSMDALNRADAQIGVLQNRDVTAQGLLTSKQAYQDKAYNMERRQSGDTRLDAAMPVINEAMVVAVNDRPKALSMVKNSGLLLEDQIKVIEEIDRQYQDRTGQRMAAMKERDYQDMLEAASLKEQLKRDYAGNVTAMLGFLGKYSNDPKNKKKAYIADLVRRDLQRDDPTIGKTLNSLSPEVVGENDLGPDPDAALSKKNHQMLKEMEESLSPGAKMRKEVDASGLSGASAATVAAKMSEVYKFDPQGRAELTSLINDLTKQARAAGKQVNEALIGQYLMNAVQDSGIVNIDNFHQAGVDLIRGDADKLIDMANKDATQLELYNTIKDKVEQADASTQKRREVSRRIRNASKLANEAGIGLEGDAGKDARDAAATWGQDAEAARNSIQTEIDNASEKLKENAKKLKELEKEKKELQKQLANRPVKIRAS